MENSVINFDLPYNIMKNNKLGQLPQYSFVVVISLLMVRFGVSWATGKLKIGEKGCSPSMKTTSEVICNFYCFSWYHGVILNFPYICLK